MSEIAAQIIEELKRTDRLPRKHAAFWNFVRKGPKEMAIFSEAITRIEADLGDKITGWELVKADPPDIALTCGAKKIAVEITELVNPLSIEAQLKRSDNYPVELVRYGVVEAKEQLEQLVVRKEVKISSVRNQYDDAILLIHTDEPMLYSDQFSGHELIYRSTTYSRVYLLFSYEPSKGLCPMVPL